MLVRFKVAGQNPNPILAKVETFRFYQVLIDFDRFRYVSIAGFNDFDGFRRISILMPVKIFKFYLATLIKFLG